MNIIDEAIADYTAKRNLAKKHLRWTCYRWEGSLYISLDPIDDQLGAMLKDLLYLDEFFKEGPVFIKLAGDFVLSKAMRSKYRIGLVEDKPLDPDHIIELSGAESSNHDKWWAVLYLLSYYFSDEDLLTMGLDRYYLVDKYGQCAHGGWIYDDPIG